MDWIKLSNSYVDDPRLGRLPEQIQARYFKLYMLAGQCDQDGVITHSPEEIAWKLHISLDELNETFAQLGTVNLFRNNGKGLEIPAFLFEQTSREAREQKREGNRQRQADFRDKHYQHMTNALVTPLESESESESEVEIESESEGETGKLSSLSSQSPAAGNHKRDALDRLITISKSDLLDLIKIPPKYTSILLTDPEIHPADILAEFAKCNSSNAYHKPASCTGMNLARHEVIDDQWYNLDNWTRLPQELQLEIGLEDMKCRSYAVSLLLLQGEEQEVNK